MTEVDATPDLRFPEFEGNWKNYSLSKVAKITTGNTPSTSKKEYYNGEYFFVSPVDLNDARYVIRTQTTLTELGFNSGRKIRRGSTLFVSIGSTIGKVAQTVCEVVTNQQINALEANNLNSDDFIYSLLFKYGPKIKLLAGNQAVPILNKTDFSNLKFFFPELHEQQKIATFLITIDERIQLLRKNKIMLEEYKKGVTQQLFSQKIRFKDKNGNSFPDWKEKRLGEIGITFNGLTGKTKVDFGEGRPYVQYMQIFSNSKINTNEFGLVKIEENENQSKVQYGDVFFTTSSETPNEIGTASVMLEEVGDVYLNSFCFGFRPHSLTELVPEFSRHLFRSELFRREIIKLAQGSTRFNMSKVEFTKLRVLLPKEDEQIKIATFLSALDDSIESIRTEVNSSVEYKKGLLQKMFV